MKTSRFQSLIHALAGLSFAIASMACQSTPTASEAKPAEAKPAEAKPVEAKPVEAKPAEAKPVVAPPLAPAPDKPGRPEVNEHGVSAEACQIVCGHILRLSLAGLPEDVDPKVREEHLAKVAQGCPAGCMREATPSSNNCVLRATTAQQAAACQP